MMKQYERLYTFNQQWHLSKIAVERHKQLGSISFIFEIELDAKKFALRFLNPTDIDSLMEAFETDTIYISREMDTQREFGTIRLEFLGETYVELWCDDVQEVTGVIKQNETLF